MISTLITSARVSAPIPLGMFCMDLSQACVLVTLNHYGAALAANGERATIVAMPSCSRQTASG